MEWWRLLLADGCPDAGQIVGHVSFLPPKKKEKKPANHYHTARETGQVSMTGLRLASWPRHPWRGQA